MANSIAELLANWKTLETINKKIKTIKKISLDVFDQQSFGPIKKHAKELAVQNNKLAHSYNDITKSIKETEEKIKNSTRRNDIEKYTKQLNKLNKQAEKHPGNGEGKEKGGGDNLLVSSIKGLFKADKLISAGKEILVKGMDQEKRIASLSPALGGKVNAAQAYSNIKGDAQSTPFDLESMYNANAALIHAGSSAEAAREDVLSLGRAVSFSGGGNEELTKMAELMAEVKSAGSIAGKDLQKFADGGVDVYAALGKSAEEVQNMTLSYDQLHTALHNAGMEGGAFAGAMEMQNETATAKLGNFTDAMEGGLGTLGTAFLPVLNKLFDFGIKLVNTLLPQIMNFIQPVIDILNSIPLDAILSDVMNMVGVILAALTPVLANLKPLFAALFEIIQPLLEVAGEFVGILMKALAPTLGAIAKLVSAVLGPIIRFVGAILIGVYYIAGKIVKFLQPIFDAINWFITKIADGINRFMDFIGMDKIGNKEDAAPIPGQPMEMNATVDAYQPAFADKDTSLWAAGNIANPAVKSKTGVEKSASKTAGEITSGGPRVVNINGVKFTEKIELHVTNAKEGLYDLELKLQEMFLRILNKGAVIQ
ncbi:hypothetical protein A4H97_32135 [Niastella yeongjuensis]|uniref:Uncharacterized protein n=1 Tax=Niastella yeongjuensis TaxID=354355 RepID=A0A1V9EIK5_9BACT|nr:hypothetical protein [Niastella yeongjuensis]OQP45892.1 hypothetical protein A4H97_32135 [Niastella yeongjuensis]SEP46803.1 hypothetical protein SAMN05660816_06509 [Niastella yeongjuensis]